MASSQYSFVVPFVVPFVGEAVGRARTDGFSHRSLIFIRGSHKRFVCSMLEEDAGREEVKLENVGKDARTILERSFSRNIESERQSEACNCLWCNGTGQRKCAWCHGSGSRMEMLTKTWGQLQEDADNITKGTPLKLPDEIRVGSHGLVHFARNFLVESAYIVSKFCPLC